MEYKLFNPDYLMNVSGGDQAIMDEIVSIFKSQIPEFVSEMKMLLASRKYLELGLLAHKAKGSVTVMGMEETARMLKDFELQAKAGVNPDGYSDFISMFENDGITVLSEIHHFMNTKR
jgi:HPt (histidine-containing phosphotransfer) domain-containing protein